MPERLGTSKHVSLVDVLDRVLAKGAVVAGDVTIAVADVDLVRLELKITLGSTDTLSGVTRLQIGTRGSR